MPPLRFRLFSSSLSNTRMAAASCALLNSPGPGYFSGRALRARGWSRHLSTLVSDPESGPATQQVNNPETSTVPAMPARSFDDTLAAARPFLWGEEMHSGPSLPALAAILRAAGAGECWHKHDTFLAHLLEVHRILHIWAAPDAVYRCGLYHSAYSNSYVNLAIFEPGVGRARVAAVVGGEAERLVRLFCIVQCQQIIHDDLLFHYSDEDLVADLARFEDYVRDARQGVFQEAEPWPGTARSSGSSRPPASVSSTSVFASTDRCIKFIEKEYTIIQLMIKSPTRVHIVPLDLI